MNSSSLYKWNLISSFCPGYLLSHISACKKSLLQVLHTSCFYGFHLLPSAFSPSLHSVWLTPALCKFSIKLPTKCTLSSIFHNLIWKLYSHGCSNGRTEKGNTKKKYIALEWIFEFEQYLLTHWVLYEKKKNKETWWKKIFYTALRLSLADCVKSKWYRDKAAFFDLESILSGSRNICHEVRNNTWLFHYIYLIKYVSFM